MLKRICGLAVLLLPMYGFSQPAGKLSVEKIMRDPAWIGASPSGAFWDADGKTLYFSWNPGNAPGDSLYYINDKQTTPVKATVAQKAALLRAEDMVYNQARNKMVYTKNGDVFFTDLATNRTVRVTQTTDGEYNARFCFGDTRIVFIKTQNLYSWDIGSGETQQLTNIKTESAKISPANTPKANPQEDWMRDDQLKYFEVLRSRKEKKDAAELYAKNTKQKELRVIAIEDKSLQGLGLSPDGRFVSYRLSKQGAGKLTVIPAFVTETGFTTDINGRTKVGAPQSSAVFYIYDRVRDTVYSMATDSIPGIKDIPTFVKDYPRQWEERTKKGADRAIAFSGPYWSPMGTYAVLDIRSDDNKDRWLMRWDTAGNKLSLLDRQHDEAWIGGPGIGQGSCGWIDEHHFWYQSEVTGYSHLYVADILTGNKKAITKGHYEVQQAELSIDKKHFYISTNEAHPGEQQFYRLDIASGNKERITAMTGANQVSLSPDEKKLAFLYSYSNRPWELFLQQNRAGARAVQVTDKAQSEEFKTYAWREPELVTFTAADGTTVYARLYKPSVPHPNKPAVLFVHGAGYLQNAHKWWSSYFREYMFNNMLADNGYYVMDIDYRASAGYGRDFRTGIYRHMGGKDLSDHVDAVKYLVKNYGVNPAHVGLYGGSYGGFISLMALFTEPGVFAAGAALRPVTDWANYNHGYTSNILNEPFTDSIAYHKSSPIYFAEGLKGNLLICHGMVDVNVHYQDAVKLTQRLIELGKDNWELASYPMEDHGFVEPSSWTDEYKRIYRLFETVLKQ